MKNIKTKKIVIYLRSFAMISMCMGITILASCTPGDTPVVNTGANPLAPVLAGCPENTDLGVITDIDAAISGFVTALTATDDSGQTLPVAPDRELSSITTNGPFTITYTASDAAGNESNSCVFTGTLETTPPLLMNCPEDSAERTTFFNNESDALREINRIINDPPTSLEDTVELTSTPDPIPATLTEGVTTLTYSIMDQSGNEVSCTFMVTLDMTPPVLVGCSAENEDRNLGMVTDIAAAIMTALDANELTATDTVDESPTVAPDVDPSSITTDGVFTITYTARDAAGNVSRESCEFTGIFNPPPVFDNCPEEEEMRHLGAFNTLDGITTAINNIVTITAMDVVSGTATAVNPTVTNNVPASLATDGTDNETYTITYTATDGTSSVDCIFTVTLDTIAPTFADCPSMAMRNLGRVNDIDAEIMAVFGETPLTAMDAVDESPTVVSEMMPNPVTEDEGFTVTYTARDAAGNERDGCSFTGTLDTTPPMFTNCPEDAEDRNLGPVNSISDTEIQNAVFSGQRLNAEDNSVSINRNLIDTNRDPNPIVEGPFTITYSVMDTAKNEATCMLTGILDTTLPTIVCPSVSSTIYVNAADIGSATTPEERLAAVRAVVEDFVTVTDDNLASPQGELTDLMETINPTFTGLTKSGAADGEYNNIIYTPAADLAGNSPINEQICSGISITIDTMIPDISCSGIIDLSLTNEIRTPPTTTDPLDSIVSVSMPSTIVDGEFSITYTAEDAVGNISDSCTFVGILDTMPPAFDANTCPDDRDTFFNTEMAALDDITRITDNSAPTSSDSSVVGDVMRDPADLPTSLSEGVTTIKYSIADAAGNTVNCNFRVIFDMTVPSIALPGRIPCMTGNTGEATTSDSSTTTVPFSDVRFGVNTLVDGFPSAVTDNIPGFPITFDLSIMNIADSTIITIDDLATTTLAIAVGEYFATVNATDASKNTASSICSFRIDITQG